MAKDTGIGIPLTEVIKYARSLSTQTKRQAIVNFLL